MCRWLSLILALGALALLVPAALKDGGPSLAQAPSFTVCPDPDKWALATWTGANNIPMGPAAATCRPKAIDTAFSWDYGSQGWFHWIAGADAVSTLKDVDNLQALFLHGSEAAPSLTPTPTPMPGARVTRVLDGDTVEIEAGQRVR